MSSLEDQVAQLTDRVKKLEATVRKLEGGSASRPKSAAKSSSNGVPRSASKTSVSSSKTKKSSASSRPPTASRRTSSDFKSEAVPENLSGSYYVGKRKVPYALPDSQDGQEASPAAAKTSLELEYVFGYNGKSCRQNIKVGQKGELIYVVAATGVVQDSDGKQRFFREHNEDISAFAAHPTETLIATGQTDPKGAETPYVCVWDYATAEPTEVGRLAGAFERGVCALAFSPDGKYIFASDMSDSHTVSLWNVPSGGKTLKKPICENVGMKTSRAHVLDMAISPSDDFSAIIVGEKTLKHYQLTEEGGKPSLKGKLISVMDKRTKDVEGVFQSVRFLSDGRAVAGGKSGKVYVIDASGKLEKTLTAHDRDVGAITVTHDGASFYTAGGTKVVKWESKSLEEQDTIELKSRPVAMDDDGKGGVYIGTSSNSIYHSKGGKNKRIVDGHSQEIWGLATSKTAPHIFATAANDRQIKIYDSKSKTVTGSFALDDKKDEVHSLAFSHDGTKLAAGTKLGTVIVLSFPKLESVWEKKGACKEQIDALNFSPNDQLLGAGSWDQTVLLINLEAAMSGEKKCLMRLKGHTSSVTHITFSADSKFVVSNSRDYEALYWDVVTAKRVGMSETRNVEWGDWQNVLGWPVRSVFSGGHDGTDVNAVNVAPDKSAVAAGDDFGMVVLYAYPALHEKAKTKEFVGHSAHVTNVRFSADSKHLVSAGGGDCGVFLWRHS